MTESLEPPDAVVADDWDTAAPRRRRAPADPPASVPVAGGPVAVELSIVEAGRAPYQIRVARGERVLLGRDPDFSEHAGYLKAYDLVSRRHASLGVDEEGTAWLRDEYATNPVRVDFVNVRDGRQVALADGADVELCPGLSATVRWITEEGA